jgi:hypothetical protein
VPRDDAQGPAGASFIRSTLKAKKVYVLNDKTAYGEGLSDEVERSLKAGGVKVVIVAMQVHVASAAVQEYAGSHWHANTRAHTRAQSHAHTRARVHAHAQVRLSCARTARVQRG